MPPTNARDPLSSGAEKLSFVSLTSASDTPEALLHLFRACFVRTLVPSILVGADGGIFFANEAAVRLLGLGRDPDYGSLEALFPAEGVPEHWRCLRQVLSGEAAQRSLRTRLRGREQSELWVELDYSPLAEIDGLPSCVLLLVQNFTELRRAESTRDQFVALSRLDLEKLREERRAREGLLRLNELRDRFVLTLSHDLRNPLSIARMGTDLLERSARLAPEDRGTVATIRRGLGRIEAMIRDLLDASRIESGAKFPLKKGHFELRGLVASALEELGALHGNRFVLDAPEEISGYWDCDGIRRILDNLVSNAIKYGAEDQPVRVGLRLRGDMADLSVHNEGAGVDASLHARIFEPFRRAPESESGTQRGWGLGLTLVSGIVEAHGGTVTLFSRPGEGATFTVSLPVNAPGA